MNIWRERVHNLFKYKDLVHELILRDLKLKYRRSFLGYLWSVLNPLLIMIVMSVVFSTIFKRNIENFPVYLFTGQVLFNFMNQSTTQALSSINANAALLKKKCQNAISVKRVRYSRDADTACFFYFKGKRFDCQGN